MDRRERADELETAIKVALRGWQSTMWTAMPAAVQSYSAAKKTVTAQPSIQGQFQDKAGKWTNATMPLCLDCPVQFPGGGDFTLTFPLKAGDEGLLVFASRCIDAWWQQGGIQPQAEFRMHDLSDGFFFPGFSSTPNVPAAASTTAVQLRANDGSMSLELDKATHRVNIVAAGGLWVNGVMVTVP